MGWRKLDTPIPDDCPEVLRCTRCKQEKPRAEFGRNRANATTFYHHCKECHKELAIEKTVRQYVQRHGREAAAAQIARDIQLARLKLNVLGQCDAEMEALEAIARGEPVPDPTRLGMGSKRRVTRARKQSPES